MTGAPRSLPRRLVAQAVGKAIRCCEIVYSAVYVLTPVQELRDRRFGHSVAPPGLRAAMVAHVYYPDLWEEIIEAWATLPTGSPLIVTTPAATLSAVRRLAGGSPLIQVHEVVNRGRDIAPFVRLLQEGRLDGFDAVLKLHTKKSPHMRLIGLRRRLIYTALAGSSANVARILRHFADGRTGMVGQRWFFRTRPVFWMTNRARVTELCRDMQPPAPVRLGFFEGTMFWVRPAALAPLRALGLATEAFEPEAGQVDGALHHAVERAISLAVLAGGQDIRSLDGSVLMKPDTAAI